MMQLDCIHLLPWVIDVSDVEPCDVVLFLSCIVITNCGWCTLLWPIVLIVVVLLCDCYWNCDTLLTRYAYCCSDTQHYDWYDLMTDCWFYLWPRLTLFIVLIVMYIHYWWMTLYGIIVCSALWYLIYSCPLFWWLWLYAVVDLPYLPDLLTILYWFNLPACCVPNVLFALLLHCVVDCCCCCCCCCWFCWLIVGICCYSVVDCCCCCCCCCCCLRCCWFVVALLPLLLLLLLIVRCCYVARCGDLRCCCCCCYICCSCCVR